MGTTQTCNGTSIPREKMTVAHLEQLPTQVLKLVASLSTHPLISVAAASYVLALLYLPRHLLSLLLSPVPLITLLLLAALLHLGSASPHRLQQEEKQERLPPCPPCAATPAVVTRTPPSDVGSQQKKSVLLPESHQLVVNWARRGPLEIIYEQYEGEAEEQEEEEEHMVENSPGCPRWPGPTRWLGLEGNGSLGICCYTDDSDEDSGSDSPAWDPQESFCIGWEAEDDGLIEIALEEDNLIEIDISACR